MSANWQTCGFTCAHLSIGGEAYHVAFSTLHSDVDLSWAELGRLLPGVHPTKKYQAIGVVENFLIRLTNLLLTENHSPIIDYTSGEYAGFTVGDLIQFSYYKNQADLVWYWSIPFKTVYKIQHPAGASLGTPEYAKSYLLGKLTRMCKAYAKLADKE